MTSKINENKDNSSVNMEHIEKLLVEKFRTQEVLIKGVNTRLDKINGRIERNTEDIQGMKVERAKVIQEKDDFMIHREATCPQNDKIDNLEQQQITEKAMKRYNARLFTISTTILAMIITGVGIWLKTGGGL